MYVLLCYAALIIIKQTLIMKGLLPVKKSSHLSLLQ